MIERRTGLSLGEIKELKPLKTGPSGRIISLLVEGTRGSAVLSKELAIRRALSESHLKSSAFIVEKTPGGFSLRGKGWGHGVGLCQIGAAVMASKGFDYIQILSHYYAGAKVEKL